MGTATSASFVVGILLKVLFGFVDKWLNTHNAKEAGRREELARQKEESDYVQNQWDKVEYSSITFDDAIGGLWQRAAN